MKLTKKEFDNCFKASVEDAMQSMANRPDINVEKFYEMVYFLENLVFFSPMVYELIQKSGKRHKGTDL